MSHADELMKRALADPKVALSQGEALLEELTDPAERAGVLRAMSMAARHTHQIEASIEYARRSAESGGAARSDELRLLGLLTMSGSLAIAGLVQDALRVIEEGIATASDSHLRARFVYQRAAVLANSGNVNDAIESFSSVLGLFRRMGDGFSIGQTLNQLGRLYTSQGRLDEAEECLAEALTLATEREEHASAHGIQHNLGLLASYRGDIPLSLEWLQRSDELYMRTSGAQAPQHVARCEVLIGVGRFEEAVALAKEIAEANRRSGDAEHEANALLVAAQAALLMGETEQASILADRAAALFGDDSSVPRAVEARRVSVEARFRSEGASRQLLDEASTLAGVLSSENQVVGAAQANLLAGRMALALGEAPVADRFLGPVSEIGSGPVEVRIQARLARALRRAQAGDRRGAAAAARSGLRLIDEYQGVLGATDLRMGLERHGTELGEIGLRVALASRRPRQLLDWMEITRARALRHRPVVTERDDDVRDALSRLRQVDSELRRAERRGDLALIREKRRLQERVRTADRVKRSAAGSDESPDVSDLVDELAGRSLVEMAIVDGALVGVVIHGGRVRRFDLGEADRVIAEMTRLRFDMRRASRRGRLLRLDVAGSLDRALFSGSGIAADELVLVPPPPMMAMPWAALPTLRETVVTVAPSAEMWWRSRRRRSGGNGVVVAGGPDLAMADVEVTEIGALYEGASVFRPDTARVEEVRRALDGSSLAHIACHASFHVENPMFSSLRLGDGELNVYDIERLSAPPSLVVLSACDSGYTEARSGDELSGLTSALLSMGTRSVVASVGLVPDTPATSELMLGFHRALLAGDSPSRALVKAREGMLQDPERFVAAASFVCIGS